MLILTIAAFIMIGIMDMPTLIKQNKKYDLLIYLMFYILALTLALLFAFDVEIPSPIKGIQAFIKDVLHLGYEP